MYVFLLLQFLKIFGVWGCVRGMPSVFAKVFVLLFLCFWHIFSLYTLLTVSNEPFLFEHLFTYCVIDSDLKGASFILLHSLLSQFDSVFLKWGKWGNSSCTAHLFCRISIIACVCNCLHCCRLPFSFCLNVWCLNKIGVSWHWLTEFSVCLSIFQDRGIGNTSLSTFGVAQAALEIILMLYPLSDPAFVCCWSSMLHGQEQHCPASFVYPGHSSARHLPEDMFCCFVTFYYSWKGADLAYLKRQVSEAAFPPAHKCFGSLIDLLNSYLMVSSVVGFYSLRVFEGLTPRKDDTTMTTVKMGWQDRGVGWSGGKGVEIASEVLMCLGPPVFNLFPLFFFFFLSPAFLYTLNSYCSLMFSSGPLTGFSWSVQYLFVGYANTGKVQAPFL